MFVKCITERINLLIVYHHSINCLLTMIVSIVFELVFEVCDCIAYVETHNVYSALHTSLHRSKLGGCENYVCVVVVVTFRSVFSVEYHSHIMLSYNLETQLVVALSECSPPPKYGVAWRQTPQTHIIRSNRQT